MGTLDGLLATGRLDLIQDADLRALLAGWPSRLENMRTVEIVISQLVTAQLLPWLRQQTALPPGGFGVLGIPPGNSPYDPTRIHNNIVFENFTRELISWDRTLLPDKSEVDRVLDEVLDALTRQIH